MSVKGPIVDAIIKYPIWIIAILFAVDIAFTLVEYPMGALHFVNTIPVIGQIVSGIAAFLQATVWTAVAIAVYVTMLVAKLIIDKKLGITQMWQAAVPTALIMVPVFFPAYVVAYLVVWAVNKYA